MKASNVNRADVERNVRVREHNECRRMRWCQILAISFKWKLLRKLILRLCQMLQTFKCLFDERHAALAARAQRRMKWKENCTSVCMCVCALRHTNNKQCSIPIFTRPSPVHLLLRWLLDGALCAHRGSVEASRLCRFVANENGFKRLGSRCVACVVFGVVHLKVKDVKLNFFAALFTHWDHC